MAKLLTFLLIAAISYAVWFARRAKARQRLAEIDEGRRCIACDGTVLDRLKERQASSASSRARAGLDTHPSIG